MTQQPLVPHLSYSAISQYCADPQVFYKKYIRHEFDTKTRLATLTGVGVHHCIEQFYQVDLVDLRTVAKNFVQEKVQEFRDGTLDLLDKAVQEHNDPEGHIARELQAGIDRVLPIVQEYIRQNKLFDVVGAEVTYKRIIGPKVGHKPSMIPLKAKIDLIDHTYTPRDWKIVATFSTGEPIKYMLQAVSYACIIAEHYGTMPKQAVFVEFLRTESDAEKQSTYEKALEGYTKSSGKKPRKPKLKDNDRRFQEIIIPITEWKIKVFMELMGRIERTLAGENMIAQGLFIPTLEGLYGDTEGWEDFCVEVLGYNPYTGEIKFKEYANREIATTPLQEGENPPRPVSDTRDPSEELFF